MAKIKRTLWNDGHYHDVLKDDDGKIISAPRTHKDKSISLGKINTRIDEYNSKHYSNPLEAQVGYKILRNPENSDHEYHYKIFVPAGNEKGGYHATVISHSKLTPVEVIGRSKRFIGVYGDNPKWEKTQILGLEEYTA